MKVNKENFLSQNSGSNFLSPVPAAILIGSLFISLSILAGSGIIKIKGYTPQKLNPSPTTAQGEVNPAAPLEEEGPVTVSLDDDPVLGDKNAPVTVVEFSDYECPFCKRHFTDTYPDLKKDYIDTGKVKLVFRDLPLPFHDPMATKEAMAANCAREQGGDESYYKYHDELFERTASNGNGLTDANIQEIAADLGLNTANFKVCTDSERHKDEVTKDIQDAEKSGATGTPTFIIGKSAGDQIEGTKLVGAQPYAKFQSAIDKLLE
jgi:protein-disulfide isomerase